MNLTRTICACLSILLLGCGARGGGGGGGSSGEDTDVFVDDLNAVVDRTYRCEPNADGVEVDCADYTVEFTLRNDGDDATESLRRVDLTIDTLEATSGPVTCADRPWQIESGDTSEPITLGFVYAGVGDLPTFFHRCGDTQTARNGGGFGGAPLAGPVTVELSGETASGGDWSATAETALRDPA
jgi:hypothetical protein